MSRTVFLSTMMGLTALWLAGFLWLFVAVVSVENSDNLEARWSFLALVFGTAHLCLLCGLMYRKPWAYHGLIALYLLATVLCWWLFGPEYIAAPIIALIALITAEGMGSWDAGQHTSK